MKIKINKFIAKHLSYNFLLKMFTVKIINDKIITVQRGMEILKELNRIKTLTKLS